MTSSVRTGFGVFSPHRRAARTRVIDGVYADRQADQQANPQADQQTGVGRLDAREEPESAFESDPESEFRAFYDATAPALLRQLHALTGDYAEAQDCLQEAFAKAWQRWPSLRQGGEAGGWVRTVAVREAISRFRKARNALRAYTRHGVVEYTPGPEPECVALVALLRQLPEDQRRALVLHYLLDLPLTEVAALTSAKVGTVKARLSRGRVALAELASADPSFRATLPEGGLS